MSEPLPLAIIEVDANGLATIDASQLPADRAIIIAALERLLAWLRSHDDETA